ncbi:hypothetical protein [Mesorhizobium sp. J18]|uniref:hypothetical protein n=1 Tax=Mesorhizobium sp. J18 TaxID=935263 RepID=UPI001FEFD713|nr:hypothetical protein [Mesorhizobium sp. J18]
MSSAEIAAGYVRRMVSRESSGWGDQTEALKRLARNYKLPFWTLNNLRIGRAKTIEAGLRDRIREAYLDLCERQIRRLQHELEIEKAAAADDSLIDIENEAEALAARLLAARAARKERKAQ